jgi:hypothetical protein
LSRRWFGPLIPSLAACARGTPIDERLTVLVYAGALVVSGIAFNTRSWSYAHWRRAVEAAGGAALDVAFLCWEYPNRGPSHCCVPVARPTTVPWECVMGRIECLNWSFWMTDRAPRPGSRPLNSCWTDRPFVRNVDRGRASLITEGPDQWRFGTEVTPVRFIPRHVFDPPVKLAGV